MPEVQPLHPEQRRRLQPYSWGELNSLPKRSPLIKGVLDQTALSVIYGDSNCGKTFLAIDMALHIAIGRPWRGMRVKQGSVLYVAAEGGLGLTERLQAFWLHHELQEAPSFYLLPTGIDLCGTEADALEVIREAHILDDVVLIVIDTLARAMAGGNENGPDDMGAFLRNCDRIREQTGAHVMIIHHSGKDTSKGGRGHSSLRAAVDAEIEVSKDASGTVTVESKKQRDRRTDDKFSFVLEAVQLGMDEDGEPISSCVLIPTDAPAHKKSRRSPAISRAVAVLNDLLLERGVRGIPKTGMRELTFVRMSDFRTALEHANISASDKPDNVRRQIQRTIETMNNEGITAAWQDMIWMVGQSGQVRTDRK